MVFTSYPKFAIIIQYQRIKWNRTTVVLTSGVRLRSRRHTPFFWGQKSCGHSIHATIAVSLRTLSFAHDIFQSCPQHVLTSRTVFYDVLWCGRQHGVSQYANRGPLTMKPWQHVAATARSQLTTILNGQSMVQSVDTSHHSSYDLWGIYIGQWIGLRENLQETIDFPIKYGVFL